MNTQQHIESLLTSTNNPQLIGMIPTLSASTYYTARCHSHHRYKGGLADHSLEVVLIMLADQQLVQHYGRENIIIAGLFHDLCTSRHDAWQHIERWRHGVRSVHILGDFFGIHLHDDVYKAIRYHMRRWKGSAPNPLHKTLRHADHTSAANRSALCNV